ncbi:MAG: helix-turn-helix domain-containing protein [Actinomycetota bacterium]|nr:helix-turn-helix domain-containing protein [Actinomycetota bacterium]
MLYESHHYLHHTLVQPGDPEMIPDPKDRPVVSAEEAFTLLGIDRSTGYKSIRDGTFPVPVLRIGRLIRIPTVALRQLLQLDQPAANRAADERESA